VYKFIIDSTCLFTYYRDLLLLSQIKHKSFTHFIKYDDRQRNGNTQLQHPEELIALSCLLPLFLFFLAFPDL